MTCTSGWFWSGKGHRSPGSGSGGCRHCCSLGRRSIAPASGQRKRWRGPKTSRGQARQNPLQLHVDATQANAALPCASSRAEAGYRLPYGLSQPTGGASCPPCAPNCGRLLRLFPFRQMHADTSNGPKAPAAPQVRTVELLGEHQEAHALRHISHLRAEALHQCSTTPV